MVHCILVSVHTAYVIVKEICVCMCVRACVCVCVCVCVCEREMPEIQTHDQCHNESHLVKTNKQNMSLSGNSRRLYGKVVFFFIQPVRTSLGLGVEKDYVLQIYNFLLNPERHYRRDNVHV